MMYITEMKMFTLWTRTFSQKRTWIYECTYFLAAASQTKKIMVNAPAGTEEGATSLQGTENYSCVFVFEGIGFVCLSQDSKQTYSACLRLFKYLWPDNPLKPSQASPMFGFSSQLSKSCETTVCLTALLFGKEFMYVS